VCCCCDWRGHDCLVLALLLLLLLLLSRHLLLCCCCQLLTLDHQQLGFKHPEHPGYKFDQGFKLSVAPYVSKDNITGGAACCSTTLPTGVT